MAKPQPKPEAKAPPYDAPPAKRIRAIHRGSNNYDVVVEEWDGPPTRSTSQGVGLARTEAQYRVRLWLEEHLGPDRAADSGLDEVES